MGIHFFYGCMTNKLPLILTTNRNMRCNLQALVQLGRSWQVFVICGVKYAIGVVMVN